MSRDRQTYSREDALEVRPFLRLFLGALAIEDETQRVRTVIIVLLAGRLGLRANEIQHLHEGWIDWEQGVIRVPAHDPCFCKWCIDAARGKIATGREVPKSEVARDDPDVLEYVYQHQYEPKPGASARIVPFGWSKRITAWLMRFFDENEYVGVTQQQMRNDVRKAAGLSEGVDPTNLTPHPLRATGATFYADAGLLSKPLRDLMGWSDRSQANRYVRASGRQLTTQVYEMFGRDDWAPEVVPEDPGETFPVACDPRPFAAEADVDPREGDPAARRERAQQRANEEEPLFNPRRERRFEDIPYEPDRHSIPGHIDPDGPGLEDPDVERKESDADLREWIGYQNQQEDPGENDEERRSGLFDFDLDEEGTAHPVVTAKVAYVACVVLVSWSLTFGSVT